MLNQTITKEQFESLDDSIKEHYKESGDKYHLDTDQATELKTALERERAERARLRTENEELTQFKAKAEKELADDELKDAKKSGDISKLQEMFEKRFDDQQQKFEEEIAKRDSDRLTGYAKTQALKLATELAGSDAELLMPFVQQRLKADLTNGELSVTVLGSDGNPSATTLTDLKQEFRLNERFAKLIVATKASGGGATGTKSTGGGATSNKQWGEMNQKERVNLYEKNQDEYRRLRDSAKQNA